MIYALDTNIISYLLKDDDKVYNRYFEALAQGNICVIPLFVYYEVRRGLKASNATAKMHSFEKICIELGVDNLTIADMDAAADIYAKHKHSGTPIDDADLIIAAQAITNGYTLVTHNTRHFKDIDGLKIEDWAAE